MLLDAGSAPSLTTGFMNYFNYFTEIETRFQQRRGSILMLSTLDWALIETWREAGVPLEAVLRGIDSAFDKRDAQKPRAGARRQRQVNGLAWCAQAVLEATEQFREASVGTGTAVPARESGFEAGRIARYLASNAALLDAAADWLRARGRTEIRGPIDYSLNYPCGLLIDGFDTPPRIMMNHNAPSRTNGSRLISQV